MGAGARRQALTADATTAPLTAEEARLAAARASTEPWRRWGPYVSERQWGTVREDYSADGNAWDYLPHDQARSRAYRWGEDGIAGISDDQQRLCFALDAVERRRSDPEGAAVRPDRQRGQPWRGREGVLLLPRQPAEPRVHEVPVQVPAAGLPVRGSACRRTRARTARSPSTSCSTPASSTTTATSTSSSNTRRRAGRLLVRISAFNRGPDAAPLHLLPTLWFRNDWSWAAGRDKPSIAHRRAERRHDAPAATHPTLRHLLAALRARRRTCSSPRTNATCAPVGAPNPSPASRRTRSTSTSCTDARDAVNRAHARHQGSAALPARGAGGGETW